MISEYPLFCCENDHFKNLQKILKIKCDYF